jgi:predicted Zn finger-like uncharacterized protein
MIVTCPDCSTRFEVSPVALGPRGRKVRCVRCAAVWHQEPPQDRIVPIPAFAAPEPPPMPEPLPNFMMGSSVVLAADRASDEIDFVFVKRPPPPKPVKPPRDTVKMVAWIAVAAAILLIVAVGILGRSSIVARWPALNDAYAAIGLPAEALGAGLELRGINSALVPANGKLSLVVAGEVANVSDIPRAVPPLTIRLRDGSNKILTSWRIAPRPGKLPPGESMPFQTSMASPPAGASSAVVTFEP